MKSIFYITIFYFLCFLFYNINNILILKLHTSYIFIFYIYAKINDTRVYHGDYIAKAKQFVSFRIRFLFNRRNLSRLDLMYR